MIGRTNRILAVAPGLAHVETLGSSVDLAHIVYRPGFTACVLRAWHALARLLVVHSIFLLVVGLLVPLQFGYDGHFGVLKRPVEQQSLSCM